MNAATVSRVLSLIPDRMARAPMGSLFDPANSAGCAHPERITHLAQFLNWLGPLQPLSKDDLRLFGLMTPYGKPAIEAIGDDEGEHAEPEADAEAELSAPLPVAAPEEHSQPALT